MSRQAGRHASIDPLAHDTLGASVVAHAIARRVRAAGDAPAVSEGLEKVHIATQARIAQQGVERANEFLAAAAKIQEVPVSMHPEGLAGALLDLDEKDELLDQARAAAGHARGRVEATAATVAALQGIGAQPDGSVLTTLGQMSPAEAVEHLAALGLTQPTRTDGEGNVVQAGDYTLHHDPDIELAHRAQVSRAIKAGAMDDPDFHPEGITRRVKTSMDFNPAQYVQTGHILRLYTELPPPHLPTLMERTLRLKGHSRYNTARGCARGDGRKRKASVHVSHRV